MEHNPATAKVATCRCCGATFRPGRRSKTYCGSACKQTAYYRRKTSRNSAHAPEAAPVTSTFFNHSSTMEHPHRSPYDSDAYRQAIEQPVNIMGMEVDQAWFADILSTLSHDQQRHLSLMLLRTIGELFPDLQSEECAACTDGQYSTSVTELQEDADEGDDNNESNEDLDDDEHNDADITEVPDESADEDAYSRSYDRAPAAWGEPDAEPHYQQHAHQRSATKHQSVTPHDSDGRQQVRPNSSAQKEQEKLGGYLSRFVSPRIRRGLTVWEELAVTIPAFMEAYLTASATSSGILVQPTTSVQAGFVTLHVLFHRTQHRRPVCRLLDLVLEAEDGALSERDFLPGGVFATDTPDEQPNFTPASEGEIDYDCFDNRGTPAPLPQEKHQYASARDVAMYSNTNAIVQLVRSATAKRA